MANTLTNVIPQILAQGLVALREHAIMPRLVNRSYDLAPASHGQSVTIPIPSAVTANDVVPAAYPQTATNLAPTAATVTLSNWKEAAFTLSDAEVTRAMDGVVPMQVTEAVRALANAVDASIFATYEGIYGYAGTAGTTPFSSSLAVATEARRELERNLAPAQPRYVVLDPDAEANALALEAFHRADYVGQPNTYETGAIGMVMGARWYMDQAIPSHTAGTLANGLGTKVTLVTGALAAGASTIAVDHTTLTGTIVEGDVLEFAGHAGTYVVTNSTPVTASGNQATGITISPALRAAAADNETCTFAASHVVNLMFHRDAFALVCRPLEDTIQDGLGSIVMSEIDEVSGLALRLEVNRQHKQTRWAFDILWGAALIRPALAARILG